MEEIAGAAAGVFLIVSIVPTYLHMGVCEKHSQQYKFVYT